MKNTFGSSITLTLFGESHGAEIGAVIDGMSPGVPIYEEYISRLLSRRRPGSAVDTARREKDEYGIVSGVRNGRTTGTPITIRIPNRDVRSSDYIYGRARPSHADYAAYEKYHGYEDARGGGHFSGRITAALVAAGGIFIPALASLGVRLGTHIKSCADVFDREFAVYEKDISALSESDFPVLEPGAGERMREVILAARKEGDSVGGITETAVIGLPAGLGEPWFDSVEGVLSHALFSLGGIKGVEFGDGFALAAMRGSEANDALGMSNGRVVAKTNHSGGINGGITNGMPVIFRCAVKPTPSIGKPQSSVDFLTGEDIELTISGRHDPAIVRRICPVIDSVAAMVLCDMLAARFGTDVFTPKI